MMSRREFLGNTIAGAAGAVVAGNLANKTFAKDAPAAKASKGDRPNVVWLMSEDNSVHYLKLYNEHGAQTPRIEELARSGVVFNQAFSNCPVCSAARSGLAVGSYVSRIGCQFHRKIKPAALPEGLDPIAALMRKAGYYTSNHTKTDYNFTYEGKIWDTNKDWHGRAAGQPFFHKQTFTITHESKLQAANTGGVTDPEFVAPCHPDTPLFRQARRAYNHLHTVMDAQIGEIVDKLDAEGLLEETFIFYFGDNGGVLPGSKGYLYETGLHIPLVVRIPKKYAHMVDVKPGTRTDGFVAFIDIGPTTLALAGVPTPETMDGKAFMGPGITNADLDSRDETFGMADRMDEKYDPVRTLRKGKYKYMRSYQPFNFDGLQNNYRYKMKSYVEWRELYKAGKLTKQAALFFEARPPEALYDIEADPYEVNNIAGDPANAKILADMRGRLSAIVKSLPDLSMFPESVLVKEAMGDAVAFGQANKARIARLVDTADLSLKPFTDAADGIAAALVSKDPWQRYWGLIACSCFGKQAERFYDTARKLAASDAEPLVRVRAAEFLALAGQDDPRKVIMDVLATTDDEVEALLTLNTLVMLRDGKTACEFTVTDKDIKARDGFVNWRLQYLTGKPHARGKAKGKGKKNKE